MPASISTPMREVMPRVAPVRMWMKITPIRPIGIEKIRRNGSRRDSNWAAMTMKTRITATRIARNMLEKDSFWSGISPRSSQRQPPRSSVSIMASRSLPTSPSALPSILHDTRTARLRSRCQII